MLKMLCIAAGMLAASSVSAGSVPKKDKEHVVAHVPTIKVQRVDCQVLIVYADGKFEHTQVLTCQPLSSDLIAPARSQDRGFDSA